MKRIPDTYANAIELIEASAGLHAQIAAVLEWPNLSPGQRMVALTLVALEFHEHAPVPPHRIAKFTGLTEERSRKIFDGVEDPPFELVSVGSDNYAWTACQALEYGA